MMGPRCARRRLAAIQVVGIDGRVKSYEVGKNGHVPVPKQRRREEEALWPIVFVVSPAEKAPGESANDSSIRDVRPIERHVPEDPMPHIEDWLRELLIYGDGPLKHFDNIW
jgi:hypothetical protein